MTDTEQPLSGITVVDLTTLLPGPLATRMLSEAGARVIKIERPGGEDMRRFSPFHEGRSVLFEQLNQGKELIEADLKSPQGRQQVEDLIADADVLVEQFRPGVMERMGLDYKALRERHPSLIYCSITGFGQTGLRAQQAGHDLNYLAVSGLLAQSCGSASQPVLPPTQIADIGGGSMPAVINILLALLHRQKTGRGSHIDIAMTEAMFTFAIFAHAQWAAGNQVPEAGTGLLTGGSPRYRLYPTKDGRMVAVAALEEKFWQSLCSLLEIPCHLRDDSRDPEQTARALAAAIQQRTGAEWANVLAEADCCATLVASFEEARRDPGFHGRALFGKESTGTTVDSAVLPIANQFRKPA
ncbi:CaiB/BaiF CoA transferase family protein [Roseibium sp.]|uniref:CaiB/BaiF CoA transferase family protein n=1 Tax=Roseibium sp. TaxID=1936156 RepID=UPI003A984F97